MSLLVTKLTIVSETYDVYGRGLFLYMYVNLNNERDSSNNEILHKLHFQNDIDPTYSYKTDSLSFIYNTTYTQYDEFKAIQQMYQNFTVTEEYYNYRMHERMSEEKYEYNRLHNKKLNENMRITQLWINKTTGDVHRGCPYKSYMERVEHSSVELECNKCVIKVYLFNREKMYTLEYECNQYSSELQLRLNYNVDVDEYELLYA